MINPYTKVRNENKYIERALRSKISLKESDYDDSKMGQDPDALHIPSAGEIDP